MIFLDIVGIFILGLAGGANPGPLIASAFAESLRNGFVKSLRIIFYGLVAETIVAAFILFLFFSINIPTIVFYIISFVGATVLIWLAVQVWKIKEIGEGKEIFTFKKIFLLTVFNGPFWIFWIAVCLPQAYLLKEQIPAGNFMFLLIFELGWLVATMLLVYIFSRFRGLLTNTNRFQMVMKIIAVILLFFAAKLIFQSIMFLIS
ncbi:MAG: LysE family transporter [Candidatus Staskawiczbacteria bacterium]|nr:LysE family transporter [Candidatus Staskawiczbacteria bacterium]